MFSQSRVKVSTRLTNIGSLTVETQLTNLKGNYVIL